MKRASVMVAGGCFVLLSAAVVFVGPRRHEPRSVATPGAVPVKLDSGAALAVLTLREDLRIDGEAELFGRYGGVVRVAANGNIVVPQGQDYQFRFYSPDGSRIGTLGREGSGPGEFRSFAWTGWVGDTLWVWDRELRRITYASAAGTHLFDESLRLVFAAPRDWTQLPIAMPVSAVRGIHGGRYIVRGEQFNLPLPASWRALRNPLVTVGSAHAVAGVVGDFPLMGEDDRVWFTDRPPQWISLPLRARPIFEIASDASRLAYLTTRVDGPHGGVLALTVLAPTGDTLVSREYEFAGEQVHPHVLDSLIDALEPTQTAPARVAAWRKAARERAQPVHAPVREMVVGRDSTIWIGFRWTSGTRTWLVVDATGEPIGSVSVPSNVYIQEAERSAIWGVQPDSNGVVSVVRLRVSGW